MDHKEFPEREDALQEALTPAFPEQEECPEETALPLFPEDTVYPDPIYPEEPFTAPEETVYPDPICPEDPLTAPEETVCPDPVYPEEPEETPLPEAPDAYKEAVIPVETLSSGEPEQAEPAFSGPVPEAPETVPAEDPEAPSCDPQADELEKELMEVSALLDEEAPKDEKFLETQENSEEFTRMVNTQPEKEPIPARDRPARKGRPKRKKGEGLFGIPNILATGVWLALILVIGVTLGRMLWVCAADVLAFGREDKPVTITIYESDTLEDITRKLHDAQLIRYPGLFKLYASFAVDEGEIRPGIWDLNTRYDYHALVRMMSPSSSRKVVEVMIPEGYSCVQIFQLLEENKVCTAQDLAAYAASGELDFYWFLEGIERGTENCLEGYLFPDTYQFYTNDSPRNVLQKMLNNFDYRFTEEMLAQLPLLNEEISAMMRANGHGQEYIDAHQLTLSDVVIVASLIEKETASAEEGYTIASVIYNRLYNWGDTPPYLNIDAAMVYALGKTDITAEDLRIDHPYNTYLYTGLTPGPIANPGLSSLKAALDPSSTNYYYYVLDPATGVHHFSRTYEEHQAFIRSLEG